MYFRKDAEEKRDNNTTGGKNLEGIAGEGEFKL